MNKKACTIKVNSEVLRLVFSYCILLLALSSNKIGAYFGWHLLPADSCSYTSCGSSIVYNWGNAWVRIGSDRWGNDIFQPGYSYFNDNDSGDKGSPSVEPSSKTVPVCLSKKVIKTCEYIHEKDRTKSSLKYPLSALRLEKNELTKHCGILKDKLEQYEGRLDSKDAQKMQAELDKGKRLGAMADQALEHRQQELGGKEAQYNATLQGMSSEGQCSELVRINKELEQDDPDYNKNKAKLATYPKQIKDLKKVIKALKSGKFLPFIKRFFGVVDIEGEESKLAGLRREESECSERVGKVERKQEFLDIQRQCCQDALCNTIEADLACLQELDTADLYNLEKDVARLYDAMSSERQRLEGEQKKLSKDAPLHKQLKDHCKQIGEIKANCEKAHKAIHEEIGQRLFTDEYIQRLQEKRDELLQQDELALDDETFIKTLEDAIDAGAQKQSRIYSVDSNFDRATLDWIEEHGAPAEEFTHFTGDSVGHHLFQRNIRTIEQVKDLEFNYPNEPMVYECGQAVVNFSSAALDASKSGQVDEAHRLTEVADSVYKLASFSVHVAGGFVEGTADCVTGLAHMLAHPIKTTKTLAVAGEKVARFLWHSGIITLIDDPSNEQARKAFDETMQSAKSSAIQLYDRWRQLPLEEKGHFTGEVLSFLCGPGAISKGAKLLGAMPKVQAGIAALGRMANAEANRLGVFARNTLLGASLATKVEGARLVTFGGKLMTSELADALAHAYNKIGSKLPMEDFVALFDQAVMPVSKAFGRAMKTLARAYPGNVFDPRGLSKLTVPQGLTAEQFANMAQLIKDNEIIKQIGGEVYVQGSRAKGTSTIISDIDIGIRVSAERFEQLIQECFNGAKNSRLRTMIWASVSGKIQRGELKLSKFGEALAEMLGLPKVDISVIKKNGHFDVGPFIKIN